MTRLAISLLTLAPLVDGVVSDARLRAEEVVAASDRNTPRYIIWLDDQMSVDRVEKLGQILSGNSKYKQKPSGDLDQLTLVATYAELRAIVVKVPFSPGKLKRGLEKLIQDPSLELRTPNPAADAAHAIGTTYSSPIVGIGRDLAISAFDPNGCHGPSTAPPVPPAQPGVCFVGGGSDLQSQNSGGQTAKMPIVWVIDSGVDDGNHMLNIDMDRAANCLNPVSGACQSKSTLGGPPEVGDTLGHGTMVAGIIAANGSLLGVAPGVPVVPVKIFDKTGDTDLFGPPLASVNYVLRYYRNHTDELDKYNVDVNISWGGNSIDDMIGSNLVNVNGLISSVHRLADLGVKVVIAAGNADILRRPNWVQFITPANAGNYHSNNGKEGAVYTVSAVNISGKFWPDSAYGNSPPDFAEPGVDILSLWPRNQTTAQNLFNSCSGTSFAAPHLAGILLRGKAKARASAANDPDGGLDPIGRLEPAAPAASCPPDPPE